MADRETVITHLQIIHTWAEFARERDLQFFTPKHLEDIAQWSDDAVAMMKEQEPVRCKDCKHGQYEEWNNGECADKTVCCDGYEIHKSDWFCADGKRKEGR